MYQGAAPLILACSHPNSFFDALVMGAYHPRKLYFLARGDAFSNPIAARVLRMLNMIPIYRISEGKENLENNRQTFDACVEILKAKGTVLIFSEGISINEWKLRPLKKGTARIANMCWNERRINDLVIQPVGINYHSFSQLPKRVYVSYGQIVEREDFSFDNTANFYKHFNEELTKKMLPLVVTENDDRLNSIVSNSVIKFLLALPALAGYILHKPFYNSWKRFIRSKTNHTVFYDSVLFASLLILYPIGVLLLSVLVVILTGNLAWLALMLLLPFTAWSYKYYRST